MSQDTFEAPLKETGTFRVRVLDWTWKSHDSGAQSAEMKLGIVQKWHPDDNLPDGGQWSGLWPDGYTVFLRSNMVKKSGEINEGAAKALIATGVWNGDVEEFLTEPPETVFIVDVNVEEYQGKQYHRADWAKPNADVPDVRKPGSLKPADPDLVRQVNTRFGSGFRAIASGQKGGASTGGGTPPPPPTPPTVGGGQAQQAQGQPAGAPPPPSPPAGGAEGHGSTPPGVAPPTGTLPPDPSEGFPNDPGVEVPWDKPSE